MTAIPEQQEMQARDAVRRPLLILASASPRRRQLLPYLYPDFKLLPADCDERALEAQWRSALGDLEGWAEAEQLAAYGQLSLLLAKSKAQFSARLAAEQGLSYDYILASDTLVFFRGQSLAKPRDQEEALRMLDQLQGQSHWVLTSVHILPAQGEARGAYELAQVHFAPSSRQQLAAYVAEVRPYDKAGAYNIADPEARFVAGLDGRISTVMGLSLEQTAQLLGACGLDTQPCSERVWTAGEGRAFLRCLRAGQLETSQFICSAAPWPQKN